MANSEDRQLAGDLDRLADALDRLHQHQFMRMHGSVWRILSFQFLRGLAFGFGTVLGASVVVSVAVFLLSQVELIPMIGTYATEIIQEIEDGRK